MMDFTLREDKDIIENIYPEYQRGFMNARYDQQVREPASSVLHGVVAEAGGGDDETRAKCSNRCLPVRTTLLVPLSKPAAL